MTSEWRGPRSQPTNWRWPQKKRKYQKWRWPPNQLPCTEYYFHFIGQLIKVEDWFEWHHWKTSFRQTVLKVIKNEHTRANWLFCFLVFSFKLEDNLTKDILPLWEISLFIIKTHMEFFINLLPAYISGENPFATRFECNNFYNYHVCMV